MPKTNVKKLVVLGKTPNLKMSKMTFRITIVEDFTLCSKENKPHRAIVPSYQNNKLKATSQGSTGSNGKPIEFATFRPTATAPQEQWKDSTFAINHKMYRPSCILEEGIQFKLRQNVLGIHSIDKGIFTASPLKIANYLVEDWKPIWIGEDNTYNWEPVLANLRPFFQPFPMPELIITLEDWKEALSRTKPMSSPGKDNWATCEIKALPDEFANLFITIFNEMTHS